MSQGPLPPRVVVADKTGRLDAGASVRLHGRLVESRGGGQSKEFLVERTEVLGRCDPEVCLGFSSPPPLR